LRFLALIGHESPTCQAFSKVTYPHLYSHGVIATDSCQLFTGIQYDGLMSIVFEWVAKRVFFDRISKTWKKPVLLTITAARMETPARRATEEYRRQNLNHSDKCRASRVKLDLKRIIPD